MRRQAFGSSLLREAEGIGCLLFFRQPQISLEINLKRGNLLERISACLVCSAGIIGQDCWLRWVETWWGPSTRSAFQNRRWNGNLLSDILWKQMENTMLINLQGKEFWKQALHMSSPRPLEPFCMLRKTEELSPSLLQEASFCGVKVSLAGEMDSMFKKSPNDPTGTC